MKYKYYKIPTLMILIATLFVACQDEYWDKHYDDKMLTRSDLTVLQYLQSRSDLSTFTQMVQKMGYDTLLKQNQTYTVWAPTNSALETVDMDDTVMVRKIVSNHITHFSYSTSAASRLVDPILVLNNKLQRFKSESGINTFAGELITEPDKAMKNGIVHVMETYAPYKQNFWEFISETSDMDSLKNYINSLTKLTLDNTKSYKDHVFVDSIFKSTNYVFDNLAALNLEDSIYTATLPDNYAWNAAYNKIYPYFNTLQKDGGTALQNADVKKMLVNNLFFRGNLTFPLSPDSIVSTSGNYFLHADRLFDVFPQELSNGTAFKTSELKDSPSETWLKTITYEAERYSYYGGVTSNYTASVNSGLGTGYTISNKNYLSLVDASTSSLSTLFAKFNLQGNLSAKYNIYCVFVPTKVVDSTDLRPYKVKFSISYTNAAGTAVTDVAVDINNSTNTKTQATFTTDPTKVQKMLVLKDFILPYRFVVPEAATSQTDINKAITLALKVTNATGKTSSEMAKYNRNIKIDCIILEPVQ